MDIVNAYLYGDLDILVLMDQPTDSNGITERPGCAVMVNKSLYGGEQCAKIWGSVLHGTVLPWGLAQSRMDSRLYFCRDASGFVVLVIFVDYMALISNNQELL